MLPVVFSLKCDSGLFDNLSRCNQIVVPLCGSLALKFAPVFCVHIVGLIGATCAAPGLLGFDDGFGGLVVTDAALDHDFDDADGFA